MRGDRRERLRGGGGGEKTNCKNEKDEETICFTFLKNSLFLSLYSLSLSSSKN
jgi:hypothetical protein